MTVLLGHRAYKYRIYPNRNQAA
ncbi:helix-turn-helix domain-containing protein [Aquibacillus sediminis]